MSEIDRDLERLWTEADAQVRAPRGFEERLFARLAAEAPVRAPAPARELLPWWVRIAAERHVAAALILAGATFAAPAWWLGAAGPASEAARALVTPWLAPFASLVSSPTVAFGLAAALAVPLALASFPLLRAIERGTARAVLRA